MNAQVICFFSIVGVALVLFYLYWQADSRRKALERELIDLRADYGSYRSMYGANRMTVMPDGHGSRSTAVLIDNGADGFVFGFYDYNLNQWVKIDWHIHRRPEGIKRQDGHDIITPFDGMRWYRLPIVRYERERMARS